ncbi:Uu.00g027300.m01.CDS01 [Anthostomella pinea]|uniref:Uu.00g027300.m01.CDS01 n=1 Tax=Anthostomella pinea TaxID=933095 RepID=A0AAI8YCP5_9PEZI|nr:Uu.00g027300.m01.CDS01 [Anthostomella pinea]
MRFSTLALLAASAFYTHGTIVSPHVTGRDLQGEPNQENEARDDAILQRHDADDTSSTGSGAGSRPRNVQARLAKRGKEDLEPYSGWWGDKEADPSLGYPSEQPGVRAQ